MFQIQKAKETMSARERVRRTFEFEKTDRVPIGYSSNPVISKKFMESLGFSPKDNLSFLKALGVDCFSGNPAYKGPDIYPAIPDRVIDQTNGAVKKYIKNEFGGYYDFCDFPLKDADDEDIYAFPFSNPDDYDYETALRQIDMLLELDFCVYIGNAGCGDIMNTTGFEMSYEDALVNVYSRNEATLDLIDRRHAVQLGFLERMLEKAADKIDFIWLGEDLGTQNTPLIDKDTYNEVLRPRHQKFIDLGKAYNKPCMIHTCGSSSWVYEDFIEMGMRGVDTLQPEAVNMSPLYLTENFGGRLNFRGCISTAGPLVTGTPEDVEKNCKETLEIMMEKKGYHFAPTHSIQDNTPVENIAAMYNAAHKYGVY